MQVRQPIVVIRSGPVAIPTVAAIAVAEGWPVLPSEPIGALLRRLFHDRPEVAVVEQGSEGALIPVLRDRRPELALLALSGNDEAAERATLIAGAHVWLPVSAEADQIRDTVASLGNRPHRQQPVMVTGAHWPSPSRKVVGE